MLLAFAFVSCGDDDDATTGFATGGYENVTYKSATVYGYMDINKLSNVSSFGIIYGTSSNLNSETGKIVAAKDVDNNNRYTITLTDLNPNTTYYYAAYIQQEGVVYKYAKVNNFTTELTLTKGECVDLGLPSGTLWASKNVGADSPEDDGLYFQWGDTKGYTSDTNDGKMFSWKSYSFGTYNTLTKYNTKSSYGSIVDNKTELELTDDAAYVNCGKDWRMPSKEQIDELVDSKYTDQKPMTINKVNGIVIVSKTNGNSIFLPSAGERAQGGMNYYGSHGSYWSRTLNSDDPKNAYYLNLEKVESQPSGRMYGLSVRAVRR